MAREGRYGRSSGVKIEPAGSDVEAASAFGHLAARDDALGKRVYPKGASRTMLKASSGVEPKRPDPDRTGVQPISGPVVMAARAPRRVLGNFSGSAQGLLIRSNPFLSE